MILAWETEVRTGSHILCGRGRRCILVAKPLFRDWCGARKRCPALTIRLVPETMNKNGFREGCRLAPFRPAHRFPSSPPLVPCRQRPLDADEPTSYRESDF
jgi:hypothetical protein